MSEKMRWETVRWVAVGADYSSSYVHLEGSPNEVVVGHLLPNVADHIADAHNASLVQADGRPVHCPHCGISDYATSCGWPGDGCMENGTAQAFAAGWRPPGTGLMLETLRRANVKRQREQIPGGGTDLGLSFRATELGGELGEFVEQIGIMLKLLNTAKKIDRELRGLPGSIVPTQQLADEGADVVICVDLLLMEVGQSLEDAIVRVFNNASDKRGLGTRL